MNEHFIVENKKYNYNMINELNNEDRLNLLTTFKNKDIRCICNDVLMRVTLIKDTAYISSFPNMKKDHKDCMYYGDSSNHQYRKGINQDGDDVIMNLQTNFFRKKEKKDNIEITPPLNNRSINRNKNSIIQNKIGFRSLVENFNLICWYYYIKNKKRLPILLEEFFKYSLGKSNSFYLNKKQTVKLSDFFYSYVKEKQYLTKEEHRLFIYGICINEPQRDKFREDYYVMEILLPYLKSKVKDNFPKKYVYCHEAKFNNLFINIKDQGAGIKLIAGTVKKLGNSVEFEDIEGLKVSELGLYGESSYERNLFNMLSDQDRLFYKPYTDIDEYGYIPDIVFMDTYKQTIGEIFGMDHEDYKILKDKKLERGKSLKNYNFWYWDAFNDKDIPPLPDKKI